MSGSRTARRQSRAAITIAAALTVAAVGASAALAAGIPPNNGTVSSPPAGGHIINSFPVRDFVHTAGWLESDRVTVNVIRNGIAIGTATAVAPVFDPKAGEWTVDVNHPGGACWEGNTPDILAGDAIRATIVDSPDVTRIGLADEIVTQNVTADAIHETAPGSHQLIVHGTAETQAGAQFGPGELESRLVANKQLFAINGRRTLRAILGTPAVPGSGDGDITYDVPGSTSNFNWTATYDLTGSPNPDADTAMGLGAESRGMWLGRIPTAANEVTTYEFGQVPGPAAPCTAPLAKSAITSIPSFVNASAANSPITVSGIADTANVASVSLSLDGSTYPAATPDAAGQWSVTVPAADVGALGEGSHTVSAAFNGSGAAPPPDVRTIVKDTVAPDAPTATPAPGTYSGAQSVRLEDTDTSATIRFTSGSGTPNTTFSAPISVTGSQTLRAQATDPAGNVGPVATLAYTITPPAPVAAPGGGGGAGAAATPAPVPTTIIQQIPLLLPAQGVQGARVQSPARPAVRGLSVAVLHGHALRVTMRLGIGAKVVRLRVLRAHGGAALLTVVKPTHGGRVTIMLSGRALRSLKAGSYVLEASAGASRSALGATSRRAFRIG